MPTNITDLNTLLVSKGEQPFVYDAETDGDLSIGLDENSDLLIQCVTSLRFRKYPGSVVA